MIYGCYETPFGTCLLGQSARGVSHLSFIRSNQVGQAIDRLQEEWPLARWQQDDTATENVVKRIFNTPPASMPRPALRAWVKGTTFQVQVWQALLSIPSGQMVSYGQLATALGRPQSARAVGNAVGANPVAWLIPCHRVIQRSGALGGYRWGGQRKRCLLAWESCQ
jgi:AraC family transcriptional regulator of adaptative response/methylated-DNA-[protein]-cysteine methyltransferase